jgi:phage replication-related protein YjqB (UPF0714/DUF867 family)
MGRDRYGGFAELFAHETGGEDYAITVVRRPSSPIGVIAPHGGAIEPRTAEIARAAAGDQFNLYLFEGTKRIDNYDLHVTSCRFDEPSCLALICECRLVVAVHGYSSDDETILLGGLDTVLKARISRSLRGALFRAETEGHRFPGTDPRNVCNRGSSGRGVQIELSRAIRGSAAESRFVEALRGALLSASAEDLSSGPD